MNVWIDIIIKNSFKLLHIKHIKVLAVISWTLSSHCWVTGCEKVPSSGLLMTCRSSWTGKTWLISSGLGLPLCACCLDGAHRRARLQQAFIVQTGQSEHLRFTTVWQHRQQHAHWLNVTSAHTLRADEVQTWPAVIQLTASFRLPNTFLLFALTVSRLHAASLPPGARVKAFLSERCRAGGWMGGWSIGSKSSKNRSKVSAFV